MQIAARGIPIHTRTLSVTLLGGDGAELELAAYVLDLRKRGFVPVAGDLQGTGIIHHMQLAGAIDRRAQRLTRLTARMPTVAFEASAATQGESCRDLVARVDALAGTTLDKGYPRRLSEEIGGPRGCSHVLTLAQLVGPTATWALREDGRLHGSDAPRRRGERVFRRDVVVDGYESDGDLWLTLQLNDLCFAPEVDATAASERFAAQLELRGAARVAMSELRIAELALEERRRDARSFDTAEWRPRPDRAEPVVGLSLRAGITAALLDQFGGQGGAGDDQPLLDALLMLAPATVQCVASFIDTWTKVPWMRGNETGGFPDSCYMWRRDGALGRTRFV